MSWRKGERNAFSFAITRKRKTYGAIEGRTKNGRKRDAQRKTLLVNRNKKEKIAGEGVRAAIRRKGGRLMHGGGRGEKKKKKKMQRGGDPQQGREEIYSNSPRLFVIVKS